MSTEAGARERRLAEELIDRLLQDLASVGRRARRSGHEGNERGKRHRGESEDPAALLFYRGQT